MELELAASTIEVTNTGITVGWSDGRKSRFHALWLRDNCASGGDRQSGDRVFSIIDLNPELFVLDAERNDDGDLAVEFSDGHESVITFEWLQANSYETHDRLGAVRQIEHFRSGMRFREFDLPRAESPQHGDLLDALSRDGVVIVNGVPGDTTGTEMVATLIGCISETETGRLSDVTMRSHGWEFSDEGLSVESHTSDAFRYTPPGVSVAHCVGAPASGGEWLCVDGFYVAADLRDNDPDAFDVLTETPIPFARHSLAGLTAGVDLRAVAPVISLDRDHEISGIRFDERAMAPLDLDPREMGEFYRSLIAFTKAVHDPSRAVQVHLRAGQALVRDNHRVLLGRSALGTDGDGGHIRLCGIDRDQFHSRVRHVRGHLERPHVNERLPGGASL